MFYAVKMQDKNNIRAALNANDVIEVILNSRLLLIMSRLDSSILNQPHHQTRTPSFEMLRQLLRNVI